MKSLVLLLALVVATKLNTEGTDEEKLHQNANASMLVKIEEDEYAKKIENSSQYIGVSYNQLHKKWSANRRSKIGKKLLHNGYYKDEETAAHASDNLARKLMKNGEKKHRLNLPSDDTEVLPEKTTTSSKFIGVSYNESKGRWQAYRYSKNGKKMVHNGCYKSEETAAHASDTSARKLMKNGEQQLKLNFPYDENEVRPEKIASSKFIGVSYNEPKGKWRASRYSKIEKKLLYNGHYKDEKTATHASDTLARKLMKNGEKNHKLNFPDDETEVYGERRNNKRRRHNTLNVTQNDENLEKLE